MSDERRTRLDEQARTFFDGLWEDGDFWELDSSPYERGRYRRLVDGIADRRYPRALEIGCGAGEFTRLLAPLADEVLALDVSDAALRRPGERPANAVFRQANVMEMDVGDEGPWDLVVLSETIYYLGWLYSFFEVGWLAHSLFEATAPGGRLLLANTRAEISDMLVRPWVIQSYRDLFLNVGYALEREEVYEGEKHGEPLEVLISLFTR